MNPFFNPAFLLRIAKSYLSDVNRIWKYDDKQLKKYQDKALRKIVRYAYTVPLYNKKYKEHGVHPDDIKGVDDIVKLPLITKEDLREYFPDGIIPKGFNKKYSYQLSSSGSTGKPVFVYCDMFSAIKRLEGFARILRAYGGNWKTSKAVLVIDLAPGSVEHATYVGGMPFLKKIFSLENIKYLSISEKPETIIREINEFQPEFIGSDPNMLRKLAILKNSNHGQDIKPRYIFSAGSMLDDYARKYIENAFDTKVLDVYGSTEAGPMSFECIQGGYHHINSDFVLLEFLDDNKKPVSFGEPGHLVVTKLYGKDTPIIRYTGLEDIAIPITEKTSCGITTEMIKKIEGRSTDLIVLPNGKMMSPLTVTGIPAKVMEEFNTYKIKQFQIIQRKESEIEILIVIDDKLRNIGTSVEILFKEMEKRFSDKIGHGVNVSVNETDNIQKDARSDHVKVVISNVKKKWI